MNLLLGLLDQRRVWTSKGSSGKQEKTGLTENSGVPEPDSAFPCRVESTYQLERSASLVVLRHAHFGQWMVFFVH